jgi:hypothetical protein
VLVLSSFCVYYYCGPLFVYLWVFVYVLIFVYICASLCIKLYMYIYVVCVCYEFMMAPGIRVVCFLFVI